MELEDVSKQSYEDSETNSTNDRQAFTNLIIHLESLIKVIFGDSYLIKENDNENIKSIEKFCYQADSSILLLIPLQDIGKSKL